MKAYINSVCGIDLLHTPKKHSINENLLLLSSYVKVAAMKVWLKNEAGQRRSTCGGSKYSEKKELK